MLRFSRLSLLLLMFAGVLSFASVLSAGRPATRPAQERPGRDARGPASRPAGAFLLERSQEIINSLKLSDEQKEKVSDIYDKAKEQLKSMRSELEKLEPQQRVQEMRELLESVRRDVGSILSEEQKAEVARKMDEPRPGPRGPEGRGGPGGPRGPGGPGGAGPEFAERLRENLQKLDLSDEQKAKVKELLESTKIKMRELREQAQGEMEQMREKFRAAMEESREKLHSILTEEQRHKLHELMSQGPGGERRRPRDGDSEMQDDMRGRDAPQRGQRRGPPGRQPATKPSAEGSIPDLKLRKLDGSTVQLSSFKDRLLVLEFGSYSCPSFRQRAAGMEQLKKDLGSRATFLVVYTREAHPAGEWDIERNKRDKVFIDQHRDLDAREAAAADARDKLNINLQVLLDDMSDSVSTSLQAGPNSLIVLREGKVLARQQWADPAAARRIIEQALRTPATMAS